ncbi:NADH dehydrogenase [Kaistia soli DSM 19436]|uniref:NADH:ubiquinone reductase (non-electrogenic) n=2 Tax=Kaistia TaxID=166953 RepID=A0A1M5LFX5_9HYPH|nr:NADH dehydrogenase [Kaistia soli DSM 19436]
MSMVQSPRTRVVVIGAGFGGIEAVRGLAGAAVDITIIDSRNHHLFQPLLYQVATASLTPSDIAWPIRFLFRGRPEVSVLMATATGIDTARRLVMLKGLDPVAYDMLIIATGARHSYFGHDDWEQFAPALKTLEDATTIRRRVLTAFEQAEAEHDPARQEMLLTFAIVGGGPTGVELAGAIAELARDTLKRDFRHIDTRETRIVLVEAGPRLLPAFVPEQSAFAKAALERLGVEVALGEAVTLCDANGIVRGDERIAAATVIWAAGVQASPAAEWLGVPADRAGRITVEPDLSVPGHPEIFAIGDTVSIAAPGGKPVPGIAPAAKQAGRHAAKAVRARLAGETPAPFRYHHDGSLATIGKRRAVIDFGWIRLSGALAWWIWGIAHVFFLIGVRHRLAVAMSWLWIYLRNQRASRLITQTEPGEAGEPPPG